VDEDMVDAFYGRAAADWHGKSFLSESAPKDPEASRIFFIDLDIYITKDREWQTQDAISAVTFFLQQVCPLPSHPLSLLTPTAVVSLQLEPMVKEKRCLTTYISTAGVTEVEVDGGVNKIKVGVHFYLPHLFVDAKLHSNLRTILLHRVINANSDHIAFNDESPGHLLVNSWPDVLDKNLGALRMYTASKAGACLHTKEERKELGCNKKGPTHHRLNFGRRYKLIEILKFDEETKEFGRDETLASTYGGVDGDDPVNQRELRKLVSVCVCSVYTTSVCIDLSSLLDSPLSLYRRSCARSCFAASPSLPAWMRT
jgi:hypothetical protein